LLSLGPTGSRQQLKHGGLCPSIRYLSSIPTEQLERSAPLTFGARIGGFTSGDTLILENLGGLAPTESETIGNGEASVAVSSGDVVTY
jgi:hypothetical protein